jgi:oxygen-independent coproporphyrinogen-3 oxidase
LTNNGFSQYEVSNFAQTGCECIHNKAYWDHTDYIGFGTSAHSFVNRKRWWNYSALNLFNSSISSKNNAVIGSEELTEKELLYEFIMLSLRSCGLNLNKLREEPGKSWYERNSRLIEELINSGHLYKNENVLKLSSKGFALCDEILTRFV